MAKKVAFVTIHGMGDTKKNYHKALTDRLIAELGSARWDKIAFRSVYYQKFLQENQESYFSRVSDRLDWWKMRKFLLYGFSDAGGLEYSRTLPNSVYTKVQRRIFNTLGKLWSELGGSAPVVFIGQSLGCHVLSNYIWDASKYGNINYGIWGEDHSALSAAEIQFRQLRSLKVLVTTGCNMPLFLAGLNQNDIVPIARPNPEFVWENYFDEDDVLGWPLRELSNGYHDLVQDKEINSGGLFASWTPFSHQKYWTDKDVIRPLAAHLRAQL